MVLLEAQACGRPVLAGDAGGTRETLKVNQTGVIVDCTKPDTLAQGITKLFQDMDRLKSMGNEGRAHVEHKFSWDQLAQEAMQCLY